MFGVFKMPGRVPVLGRVAAANVSTQQAHSQVNPGITGRYAVLTDPLVGFGHSDLIEVCAF
jgi:hypothetical protein